MTEPTNGGTPSCPHCGSAAVLPIIYGEPDIDMVHREAAGEMIIGGCSVYDDSPTWSCSDCGRRWGAAHAPTGVDTHETRLSREEEAALAESIEHMDSRARKSYDFLFDQNGDDDR